MALVEVKATGLKEARGAATKLKRTGPQRLKIGSRKAAQLVVATAKPRVPTGPGKGGHAKNSIKVTTVGGLPGVTAGGDAFPYYPWLDFGGRVGPKRRTHRPWIKSGRYVWAAYKEKSKQIEKIIDDEMVEAARDAGWDVID